MRSFLFVSCWFGWAAATLAPVEDGCQAHCSDSTCHSHNPFGGCAHAVSWNGQRPLYDGKDQVSNLGVFVGDTISFAAVAPGDSVFYFINRQAWENCNFARPMQLPAGFAARYTIAKTYYYASQSHCTNGKKLAVEVSTTDSGLQCHDHAHGTANEPTCHCHSYEEIACPEDEPFGYTLYREHIKELEQYCGAVTNGIAAECPFKCAQPMEVLHLHYLECPNRMKDPTYLGVEATGMCHPFQQNTGNRACPAVAADVIGTSNGMIVPGTGHNDESCELHCSDFVCHSHNPFGACVHFMSWTAPRPRYRTLPFSYVDLFVGDSLTFQGTTTADTMYLFRNRIAWQNCDFTGLRPVMSDTSPGFTVMFDEAKLYHYASRQNCRNGLKLTVEVQERDAGLRCHDHAHSGARKGASTCHCHSYEEILCPEDEPFGYTLYTEHIEELEEYCGPVTNGAASVCPFKCAQPMEVLHLHYLECPTRAKDRTFLSTEATGMCHPFQANNGDRSCPSVNEIAVVSRYPPMVPETGRSGSGGNDESCEAHCSNSICHSHNPFGGCTHTLSWTSPSPLYGSDQTSFMGLFVGDMMTFRATQSRDTVYIMDNRQAWESCDFSGFNPIVLDTSLGFTKQYDHPGMYYYASGQHCRHGLKLTVEVSDADSGLKCHDHRDSGAPRNAPTCHCHSYEEILCPEDEPRGYTLYTEHIEELEEYCGPVLNGFLAECPYKCAQPMEVLHLHYLECPTRAKDRTFLAAEATGRCHPVQANDGNRSCPKVDDNIDSSRLTVVRTSFLTVSDGRAGATLHAFVLILSLVLMSTA